MSEPATKTPAPGAAEPTATPSLAYRIPASHPWAGLWKVWLVLAVVGAVLAGRGYMTDPKRFAFSYLAAFAWGLTLALGGLFFVLLQHLTGSGWSVVLRRGAEQLMGTIPVFLVLFVPIVLFRETLYPWAGHGAHEAAIQAKAGYLNTPFWLARAFVYLRCGFTFVPAFFALPASRRFGRSKADVANAGNVGARHAAFCVYAYLCEH